MKLRNSLINMLGEFIGLHKTPDFKLNAQSSQAITEAVAAETRRYSMSMNDPSSDNNGYVVVHQRLFSTNSAHESNDLVNMDPSYRRLSEPTSMPSFTPPRRRHIEQRLLLHFQKKKSRKQKTLSSFFGRDDKEVNIDNDINNQRQRRHTRRGSETFCGSVAAYSNNLSTINTRL
ncbi:unnamed protein product [Acanthocheilonema viteae]|uniref:Uncharacterized protein n=1 Tax=Acanthocheilonema viteae TaxID=6277 RepID=A0A498SNB5_ACAVI|nr:unnamed protein product [Acanthocheilonema viteae]